MLTSVALAEPPCDYYAVDYKNLDNPSDTYDDWCVELCFNYGDYSGTYVNSCGNGNLVLFFDSMNKTALMYSTITEYSEAGYLKFHGDRLYIFTGIIDCGEGYRYEVRGHKSDECENGM
jgi:hypothetical protein